MLTTQTWWKSASNVSENVKVLCGGKARIEGCFSVDLSEAVLVRTPRLPCTSALAAKFFMLRVVAVCVGVIECGCCGFEVGVVVWGGRREERPAPLGTTEGD